MPASGAAPATVRNVEIREASAEDWPGIWSVMEPVVRAGETYTWDPATPQEDLRRTWLHQPGGRSRTLVAVLDGEVVGTADLHPNYGGGAASVANAGFMVAAGLQGRGIARALAERVLSDARELGFRAMVFNAVVASNTRAVALWQSLGFTILGTVPDAFLLPDGTRAGLHVMHRSLVPDGG